MSELPPPPRDGDSATAAAQVRRLLASRAGLPESSVADHLALGGPELGLDSVALVELVLECERLTGVVLAGDVFAGGPLTVGDLLRRLATAPAAPPAPR